MAACARTAVGVGGPRGLVERMVEPGPISEAIDQLELAARGERSERQSMTAMGVVLMVLAGQVGRAASVAGRAAAAAGAWQDHALCLGLQALALVSLAGGFTDRAVALAHRAVVVARRNKAAWTN